jgi:hypothetical protein
MSLANSFHTQLAIGILLNDEKELEAKLDLLTAIGLAASSEETFEICEGFRERLCGEKGKDQGGESLLPVYRRKTGRDSRDEIVDGVHGGE